MNVWLRRAVKVPALVQGFGQQMAKLPAGPDGVTFLVYHSVAGRLGLELDLEPGLFARQVAALAHLNAVIGYDDAVACLRTGAGPAQRQFVLTFDDGYACFYTHVFPLLQRWQLPAMLFVTTGFVEDRRAYALDGQPASVTPVTWEMLGEMAESRLVTLGAHTHTHPQLVGQPADRIVEELERPRELMLSRLGLEVQHFAYPRAQWDVASEQYVARVYATAAIGGGRPVSAGTFHPHRIPRLPVRRSDGWWFFQAKLRGWLYGEEALYAGLRRVRNALEFGNV